MGSRGGGRVGGDGSVRAGCDVLSRAPHLCGTVVGTLERLVAALNST